ncbi:hypothetical protein [Planococcus lenghuensis]|uniref:Uncharacterized protein n=1 Tax=Planococcus lenghuensis TaxID=2213202 RepID=A0A1Q2L365_9BACL|nr:hypothetical protein [Planococcus lenghuensis]AQQ54853.1 hypothetical protein B0X71_18265 [Planococcus lenghuensis]
MTVKSTMSPDTIVAVWPATKSVFEQHNIALVTEPLTTISSSAELDNLIDELNKAAMNPEAACSPGG